jgi:hypothetical protein
MKKAAALMAVIGLMALGTAKAAEPVALASVMGMPAPATARTGFNEVYAFPNPAVATSAVTFHAGIDNATGAQFRVYDAAGQLVHEGQLSGDPSIIQGTSAYEYKWNIGSLASGAYFLVVKADGTQAVAKKTFIVVR